MSDRPWLEGLNPPQREAVEHVDGPLLILAGAGSGKTRALTRRMAHLLSEGVAPWQILAVTFTNKAAAEMKHRVAELLASGPFASSADRILVSTFHSACARFLRQDIEVLGYRRDFSIYDTDDQDRLLKVVCADLRIDPKAHPLRKFRSRIDDAKNRLLSPEDLAAEMRLGIGDPTVRVFRGYEDGLRAANAVDFNDLVNLVVRLWSEHPVVLARYQRRFRYLMVDEYQDTNRAQYMLVKLLAAGTQQTPGHRNVAVVGDDDQSIYRFRGADVRNILDFEADFPSAKVVRLEQNYRSTGNILLAASSVVAHNGGRMEKTLWTAADAGHPVTVLPAADTDTEARIVVDTMSRLEGAGEHRWGDFAIIYRTNAASRAFELELVRRRIPHLLVGARKFYERREVKDLLAYLKLALNPTDEAAFSRVVNVPSRGLGAKTVEAMEQIRDREGIPLLAAARLWSSERRTKAQKAASDFCACIDEIAERARVLGPGELVMFAAERSGYAEELRREETPEADGRLQNIEELANAALLPIEALALDWDPADGGDPLAGGVAEDDPLQRLREFIDRGALASQADELPADAEGGVVTLLTAHLAKGLEFPIVFVAGMVEGGFPHFMAMEQEDDIEEERRLVYVAFTRAQERLYLTRPRRRMVFGSGFRDCEPSRFLREIPPKALQHAAAAGSTVPGRFGRMVDQRVAAHQASVVRRQASQADLFGSPSTPPPSMDGDEPLRTMVPESIDALQVGTRVVHPRFGEGVVRRCEGSPANRKLHIHFETHGRKTVLARYANLEIVIS